MFSYVSADVKYAVTFGKLDGSSDIDYSADLNKKEARIYTKARMLGEDLDDVMDTSRIEREIICYERSEYDSDIRDANISISFCNNIEQPPIEDIKEYLKDLLKARRYEQAYDVVEAQINVFFDTKNDWKQIALDLAKEMNCPGYIKKYKDNDFVNTNRQKQSIKNKLKLVGEKYLPKIIDTSKPTWVFRPEYNETFFEQYFRYGWEIDWNRECYRGCKVIIDATDINHKYHLITKSGKEVPLDAKRPFSLYFHGNGICPYNSKEWNNNTIGVDGLSVAFPNKGAYSCEAGTWGFFNTEGKTVVEPQYVYAYGAFGATDDEYFVVAKYIDGRTYWGILDTNGKETIPCRYTYIHHMIKSNTIIYQGDNGLLGLMNIDGTIVLEPTFCRISLKHNLEKGLIIVGPNDDCEGVFSLEKNDYIVPYKFDAITIDNKNNRIIGEYFKSNKSIAFDFDGKRI